MGQHLGHIILFKKIPSKGLFFINELFDLQVRIARICLRCLRSHWKLSCTISQYSICFQRSWGDLDCSAQRFVQNWYHSYRYVFIGAHPLFEPLASTGWPTLIIIICASSLDNVFSHSFRGIFRLQSSSQQPLAQPGKHFSPWICLRRVVQISL